MELQDGTNPVVVNSGNSRSKLHSREHVTINGGDLLELIPGHYFFKYVVLGGDKNVSFLDTHKRVPNDGREPGKGEALNGKRLRRISEDEIPTRISKVLPFKFVKFLTVLRFSILVFFVLSTLLSLSHSTWIESPLTW